MCDPVSLVAGTVVGGLYAGRQAKKAAGGGAAADPAAERAAQEAAAAQAANARLAADNKRRREQRMLLANPTDAQQFGDQPGAAGGAMSRNFVSRRAALMTAGRVRGVSVSGGAGAGSVTGGGGSDRMPMVL